MNKCKVMISIGLFFSCFNSLQATQKELKSLVASRRSRVVDGNSLFVPGNLGKLSVTHNKSGFSIKDKNRLRPVYNYNLSKELRGISKENLSKALVSGYLSVNRADGEYSLKYNARGPGGLAVGATIGAYVGKWGTYAVGHGAIVGASLLTGWGCLATFASLEAQFAAPIEAASNVAAVAGGVIGGAGTPI